METIGRLASNATVEETKYGKMVVKFLVIEDHSYFRESQKVEQTTLIGCTYHLAENQEKICRMLRKGTMIKAEGYLTARASADRVFLNLRVSQYKILQYGKKESANNSPAETPVAAASATGFVPAGDPLDDLPF